MKMVPYDYRKIGGYCGYRRTKWQKIVDDFLSSGDACVEIVDYTNKDARSCAGALNQYIKRSRMYNTVYAISRKSHVYLVRNDKVED